MVLAGVSGQTQVQAQSTSDKTTFVSALHRGNTTNKAFSCYMVRLRAWRAQVMTYGQEEDGRYICEVRYGGATANALQRGFWTHT